MRLSTTLNDFIKLHQSEFKVVTFIDIHAFSRILQYALAIMSIINKTFYNSYIGIDLHWLRSV